MMTNNLKNIKQTVGFFSISLGWILTNLLYSIYLGWTYGKATDSGVILVWSGLFVYLAWAIFIIYPLDKLDHTNGLFKPHIFPLLTTVYAALTYAILVGLLFRDLDLVLMFMPLALSIGLFFGLTYSILTTNDTLVHALNDNPKLKIISFLFPIAALTFFLWLLPILIPSFVYRFMPDDIQDKIFVQTIMKYKVGDSFEKLKNEVPGYFDNWGNNGYYKGPLIEYHLEIAADTIKTLDIKLTN